jgi:L-threonylcarbamoyladenylate synthase
LDGKIEMVLDAGSTTGGLESTVLDVTITPPRLLRPGLVTPAMLEAVIGPIQGAVVLPSASTPARSPGLQGRHYAPRAPLEVVEVGRSRVEALICQGLRAGWVTHQAEPCPAEAIVERLSNDAASYAASLYAALHRLDKAGVERIIVDRPPMGDAWLAVHDRLRRAAFS